MKAGATPPDLSWLAGDPTKRGQLAPIEWNERTGQARLALPQALLDLFNTIALPGEVMAHPSDYTDMAGNIEPLKMVPAATTAAMTIGAPSTLGKPNPSDLNIFAGPRAKTADLKLLTEASGDAVKLAQANKEMGVKGLTDQQVQDIYANTGWFPGADNKWKFEIPDNLRIRAGVPDAFTPYAENFKGAQRDYPTATTDYHHNIAGLRSDPIPRKGTFEMFLDHPELFKAYPELAAVPTNVIGRKGMQAGVRDPGDPGAIEAEGFTPSDIASVLLHEAQHYVQEQEGFAGGGNPEWTGQKLAELVPGAADQLNFPAPYDIYRALMGETEARQVQNRYELGYSTGTDPRTLGVPSAIQDKYFGYDIPRTKQLNPNWLDNPSTTPGPEGYGSTSALLGKLLTLKMALGNKP